MITEQIYTGCLAHGAYYIESNGEAAIIDPLREVEPYIKKATVIWTWKQIYNFDFYSWIGQESLDKMRDTYPWLWPSVNVSIPGVWKPIHKTLTRCYFLKWK